MSRLLPVLLGLAVGVLATAQTVQAACQCPEPSTVKNFDPTQYFGTWLEMRRVARSMEQGGQCGTAHYSWTDSTQQTVDVVNTNFLPDKQSIRTVNLLAAPVDLKAGKLTVTWPSMPFIPPSMYWVLDTDYTNYAVVYSCGEDANGGPPAITMWVLARSLQAYQSEATQKAVADALMNSGLPTNDLEDVHQTSCPPASCPACPASVQNLDLDKLSGRWWEVQHSPFAMGGQKQGCSRSLVSKTADGVQIDQYTTVYMPETEESDNVNNSLSAKWTDTNKPNGDFTITKGFSGDSADRLCILGTDYDNWAVVSVCAKQSGNPAAPDLTKTTTGGVWVLSRKRGLSRDHQMAANKAVIAAGVPVADLVMTPSTPCSDAALDDGDSNSSSGAAMTPITLLVAALAAAARLS